MRARIPKPYLRGGRHAVAAFFLAQLFLFKNFPLNVATVARTPHAESTVDAGRAEEPFSITTFLAVRKNQKKLFTIIGEAITEK